MEGDLIERLNSYAVKLQDRIDTFEEIRKVSEDKSDIGQVIAYSNMLDDLYRMFPELIKPENSR